MGNSIKWIIKFSPFFIGVIILILFVYKNNHKFDGIWVNQSKIELPVAWSCELKYPIKDGFIITSNDMLYCISNNTLYKMNATTGNIIDTFEIPVSYKKIVLHENNGKLYCIADEKISLIIEEESLSLQKKIESNKWQFYEKMLFDGDKAIFYAGNGYVTTLDINTEKILNKKIGRDFRSVKIYNGILYYTSSGINVYAVDTNSLNIIWKYDENTEHTSSIPKFSDGKVYLNTHREFLIFNYLTGNVISKYDYPALKYEIEGKYIYFSTQLNDTYYVIKMDKDTGRIIWKKQGAPLALFLSNEYICYFDRNTYEVVKMLKDNGEKEWGVQGRNFSNFESTNKYDIFMDFSPAAIYLLEPKTGIALWDKKEENMRYKIFKEHLYVVENQNVIKSFDLGS